MKLKLHRNSFFLGLPCHWKFESAFRIKCRQPSREPVYIFMPLLSSHGTELLILDFPGVHHGPWRALDKVELGSLRSTKTISHRKSPDA